MIQHRSLLTVCIAGGLVISPAWADELLASDAQVIHDGDLAGDQFGRSVVIIGDIDGDGRAEYAIGMRGNISGVESAGRVTVYSGATNLPLWSLNGESAFDHFGESIAAAGDVDGDGLADLIVGAWNNGAGGAGAGRAYVYSGAGGPPLFIFTGDSAGDNLGDAVAGAGDVNGDGYDDLIVGSPTNDVGASNTGTVRVYSGLDGSIIHTMHGENANDRLGVCVAGIGDVNGDGFDDVAAGSPLFDDGGPASDNRGRVCVFSGATGERLYSVVGQAAGDNFGWAVSGAGDINADGSPDFIVGAPLNDARGSNTGRVYAYSGQDGQRLHMFTGEAASDKLGLSVSAAGDVDGDGHADILTSAWWNDAGGDPSDNRGRAYIYSGRSGEILFTMTGEDAGDHLGRPVSGGRDVNGDGTPDVLVGARDNNANGIDAGRAYLFHLPGGCRADFSGDGIVDVFDVFAFLVAFAQGDPEADLTGDGVIDVLDVAAFLELFAAGCP